jgi:ubiquitin carboxyl-terminal hydrolase L5
VPDSEKRETQSFDQADPDLFFANQVITNACATQAILAVLMNKHKELQLGETLDSLRQFSMALPFRDRGEQLGNCD